MALQFKFSKKFEKNGPLVGQDQYQNIEKNDQDRLREYLRNSKVPENEVYGAVIRLGQSGDKLALEVATKLKASPSKYLREGAAQALGYFSDQAAIPELKDLLKDKEESVRVFAIESLGVAASEQRQQVIEDLLKSSLGAHEKVTAYASLFRVSGQPNQKKLAFENLLSLANSSDAETSRLASFKAMQVSAQNNKAHDLMVSIVKANKDENLSAVAIRNLANENDPLIKEKISELVKSDKPGVRIASLQSLHRVCPDSRWSVLESVLKKEKDERVRRVALDELSFLDRKTATALLKKIVAEKKIEETSLKQIEAYSKELETHPVIDACKK